MTASEWREQRPLRPVRLPRVVVDGLVYLDPPQVSYRPLRLTRRGQLLRDVLTLLVLAAFVVGMFLLGQHRQTSWCHQHPTQAGTVEGCQTGPHR